jgi:bifunctional DNA-binding transcriptional regulator/antitoxin component of YhaV-PrlF toxin-antitoxin module
MNNTYVGNVVEENGETFVTFPVEMLSQMGWDEGTLVEWLIQEDRVVIKEVIDGKET